MRFHVPLLFYAPALLTAEETPRKAPCSHLDIAPTLLRLTGDEEGRQFWGRDLFALDDDDPGLAYFKPSAASSEAALVRGDEAIIKTNDGRTKHYRYDLGFPPRIEELPDASPERDELDAYLHAYLQTAASSLENRRVARSTAGKLR